VGEKGIEGKEEREDVREWREGGKERWIWRGERGKIFLALDALISVWMVISNPSFLALYAFILV